MLRTRLGYLAFTLIMTASTILAQGSMRGSTGRSIGTEGTSMPNPEPLTLTLLALGAGGVGVAVASKWRARRKQRDDSQSR
jgi:hypothetical protein